MKAHSVLVVLLLALLALLPAAVAAKAPEEDVDIIASGEMSTWGYSPSTLTVSAGTTITWHNTGSQAHSVTSRDHLFDSRLLDEDDDWSYTFTTPGTYRYFCVPYPWMKGTIVVTAAEEPSPRASATPTATPAEEPTPRATATPAATPTATPTSGSSSAAAP